ncbi:MAG: glycosyltransferase [Anaerolineae bacterium]|nr:glycosyltransferase [Anaerolineae bacterium]
MTHGPSKPDRFRPFRHFIHRNRYRFNNLKNAWQVGGPEAMLEKINTSLRLLRNPVLRQHGVYLRNESPFLPDRETFYGEIVFQGWAYSLNTGRSPHIEFRIDGERINQPVARFPRPTLQRRFPDIPPENEAGYRLRWSSESITDGRHVLEICALDASGAEVCIQRQIQVNNEDGRTHKYQRWIQHREPRQQRRIWWASLRAPRPLFTVLLILSAATETQTRQTIDSIRRQRYKNWTVRIIAAESLGANTRQYLDHVASSDSRVQVEYTPSARATAQAMLPKMSGGWLLLLQPSDQLARWALSAFAVATQSQPESEAIYSDHDMLNAEGLRCNPCFKPDWSPDLLRFYDYIQSPLCIKKTVLPEDFTFGEGAIYELLLRLSERKSQITHIAQILCHRPYQKQIDAATLAQERQALTSHIERQGWHANLDPGCAVGTWHIQHILDEKPPVAVLIPSAKPDHFENCLRGLAEATDYPHVEVVFIDTSPNDEMHDLFMRYESRFDTLRYVDQRDVKPFNFSTVNNQGVQQSTAPHVLFLNDDTYPINPGWLLAMVEHIQRPEVGCVGAKLLYDDGTIQHAGIIVNAYKGAAHSNFQPLDQAECLPYNNYFPNAIRNVSAVTGACLLTRRDVFKQVDGFDEVRFPMAFQDVDYGLKVLAAGYDVVYTPYAELYHYESKTKSLQQYVPTSHESRQLREKWAATIIHDPFYNPNLKRDGVNYDINL